MITLEFIFGNYHSAFLEITSDKEMSFHEEIEDFYYYITDVNSPVEFLRDFSIFNTRPESATSPESAKITFIFDAFGKDFSENTELYKIYARNFGTLKSQLESIVDREFVMKGFDSI